MKPRAVSIRGQAIRGTTGTFQSLRAQTLTLGRPLKRVVAEKVNVSELTIGGNAADGLMDIKSDNSSEGRIVVLPKWSTPAGGLQVTTDQLLSSITTNSTNATDNTYNAVATTTTKGNGTGAMLNLTVVGGKVTQVTVLPGTNSGRHYAVGDTFTVSKTVIGGSTDVVFTLKEGDINGGPDPQLTFYNSNQLTNGTFDLTSSYKVDISQNLQVQGNVFANSGGDYNAYHGVFCKELVIRSMATDNLKTAADALLGSITTNTTAINTGAQAGLATTTSGSGSGAVLTIVASETTAVTGVTVTTQGTGYKPGDTLTVAAANIQGSATDLVITLVADDFNSVTRENRLSHLNGVLNISGDGSNNGALTSDDRLKHNETDIKNAVATLAKLQPVVYDKTETFLSADFKGPLDAKVTPYRKESGFIAQDVQKISELQHLVTPGSPSIAYTLDYHGLLAYMVKASQEMAEEIKALKTQVQELKSA